MWLLTQTLLLPKLISMQVASPLVPQNQSLPSDLPFASMGCFHQDIPYSTDDIHGWTPCFRWCPNPLQGWQFPVQFPWPCSPHQGPFCLFLSSKNQPLLLQIMLEHISLGFSELFFGFCFYLFSQIPRRPTSPHSTTFCYFTKASSPHPLRRVSLYSSDWPGTLSRPGWPGTQKICLSPEC